MRQITLTVAGLKTFWTKCFARNGKLSHGDCCPVEVKEVQNSIENERVPSLKTELDEIKTQIRNIKDEIIKTLRDEMKIGEQQHQELNKRTENLKQSSK